MRSLLIVAMLVVTGCASDLAPPQTVGAVDLRRYQGTWYEQARLPMFFQRNCLQSEALYRLRDDGSVAVTNRCTTEGGGSQQVEGTAVPQVAGQTDKLWVQFDTWFSRLFPGLTRGEYWILALDDDYRSALVGHPNRKYLWLLTREPRASDALRERLLEVARQQGYDTERLIWRPADPALAGQ
ncbi:MAG: lipocalin family protein [Pseudomonas sp.]|uniref:lipocalin family protein n=1 Tax=Pseudomonas sp. TaxID=306 RepID=UPI00339565E4